MKLIVGLGNPGKEYENTHHNMGFLAISKLANEVGTMFSKKECKSLTAHCFINAQKVILAKPETFMNLSGDAVSQLKSKYKLNNSDILVISDDVDIPKGVIRFREGGSAGTHNGLRDIVAKIGSDFPRVRIGIGKEDKMDLADFVLSKINNENMTVFEDSFEKALIIVREKFL